MEFSQSMVLYIVINLLLHVVGQDLQCIRDQGIINHVPVVLTVVEVELPVQSIKDQPKHPPLKERIAHQRKQLAQK